MTLAISTKYDGDVNDLINRIAIRTWQIASEENVTPRFIVYVTKEMLLKIGDALGGLKSQKLNLLEENGATFYGHPLKIMVKETPTSSPWMVVRVP